MGVGGVGCGLGGVGTSAFMKIVLSYPPIATNLVLNFPFLLDSSS